MATIAEAFNLAWQNHQAGYFAQAEQLYRQILQADPGHADAWCFLGAACQAQGRIAEAENNFRRAVQVLPSHASAHNCLGVVLAQQGKLGDAVDSLRKAKQADPDSAEILNNLGVALAQYGRPGEAVEVYRQSLRVRPGAAETHYNLGLAQRMLAQNDAAREQFQQALRLRPEYPEALNDLGNTLAELQKPQEALNCYAQALRLRPQYAEAHYNFGFVAAKQGLVEEAISHYREALRFKPDYADAHINLGNVLRQNGQWGEAVACFYQALRLRPQSADIYVNLGWTLGEQGNPVEGAAACEEAIRLKPDCVEAYHNLGLIRKKQGQLAEAAAQFQKAFEINPEFAPALTSLGNVRQQQGQVDEAIDLFRQSLTLDPKAVETHNSLGVALTSQARFDDAFACYQTGLEHSPDHAETHLNRALLRLLLGQWKEGWPEYDWRLKTKDFPKRSFRQPRWDGSPLQGRTILLLAEQGMGDTLQFVRYVPLIEKTGGRALLQCQPALERLLGRCLGAGNVATHALPLPNFDVYAPLMSLPLILGITQETIPAEVPYLHAADELVEQWRTELAPLTGFKVGISWQGSPTFPGDRQRSMPLSHFAALANVPGVQLISLQKGPGTDQLASLAGQFKVHDLGGRLDESSGAFMDTAAVMKNLDLVISSDTAVPHLAGALGVPVWVALPVIPDWRWQIDGGKCPWYSTMHLFRQTQNGQWADVFERMANALESEVRNETTEVRTRIG